MFSLTVYVSTAITIQVISAWLSALAARAIGSPRGRFAVGLLVQLLLNLIAVAAFAVYVHASSGAPADPMQHETHLKRSAALAVVQLALAYAVIARGYRLPASKAWAPFVATVLANVMGVIPVLVWIRPQLSQAYVISGQGMEPTLAVGTRLCIHKHLAPRRLDFCIYLQPGRTSANPICKRVLALPGERIRFSHGNVFVNNQLVALPPALAGKCHVFPAKAPPSQRLYAEDETIALGADEYFVIGDNVDYSYDSRLAGPIPGSAIIGTVDWIYWPIREAAVLR